MNIALLARKPTYSSKRLAEEAGKNNHGLKIVNYEHCKVRDDGSIYYGGKRLERFDVVLPRIMPELFELGLNIARAFEVAGYTVIDKAGAIENAGDKFETVQLLLGVGISVPKTKKINVISGLKGALTELGLPLVIKLSRGAQGSGVQLAHTSEEAEVIINGLLASGIEFSLQEFIAEAAGMDLRAFVVDGKVVAAIERQAKPGEFRSNLYLGGTAKSIELSEVENNTAVYAAKAMGLKIAGVDILRSKTGPKVLEVNATPGLEGIETASGRNVAGAIIKCIEKHSQARN